MDKNNLLDFIDKFPGEPVGASHHICQPLLITDSSIRSFSAKAQLLRKCISHCSFNVKAIKPGHDCAKMRFAAVFALANVAIASVGAVPAANTVETRDLSLSLNLGNLFPGFDMSNTNHYGAPIPPWKPGSKPGWYYGPHPGNHPSLPCLGGLICAILDLIPFIIHCPPHLTETGERIGGSRLSALPSPSCSAALGVLNPTVLKVDDGPADLNILTPMMRVHNVKDSIISAGFYQSTIGTVRGGYEKSVFWFFVFCKGEHHITISQSTTECALYPLTNAATMHEMTTLSSTLLFTLYPKHLDERILTHGVISPMDKDVEGYRSKFDLDFKKL
ncbi:hypothetical protein NP233_g9399 [Leucocoprinus birnbaumii]|uniref:Uncharacterized protein n=1 Tax=Leucocoprinus birnbaumii TaxID=56174 RepID=A0AAD5YQW4_9AGAR|nr:hypothetical protein NP233_g9399 [Leucocoprinus birnbaumii]